MTIRVHNVTKWTFLPEGEAVRFERDKARTVILEVNCPQATAFYIRQDREAVEDDEERIEDKAAGRLKDEPFAEDEDDGSVLTFIGLVTGRERIEFGVSGPFELMAEGGGCYFFTNDGVVTSTHIVAPVIFTRIANRRQRNPHLEMMQYQMRLNQQRFEEQMKADFAAQLDNVKKGLASYAPQRDVKAPPESVGKSPAGESEVAGTDFASATEGAGREPPDEAGGDKKKRGKAAVD